MSQFTIRYDSDSIRSRAEDSHPSRAALHELKNILTAIGGHLPALRAGRLCPGSSLELAALVEHSIVLSRHIQRPVTDPGPVSVKLDQLLGRLTPIMKGMVPNPATLRVHTEGSVGAHVPRGSIESVLLNLVANAARAIPPNGSVDVRARSSTHGIELEVSDDGTGVDQRTLDGVFSPTTLDRATPGLGLVIVRDTLALLDASLSISSGRGGTSFRIRLPAP